MIDFTKPNEVNHWRITNDSVMGGRSEGSLLFINAHCIFTGNISKDNNGGFSSIYRPLTTLSRNIDRVQINIKGDGLTYQLRLVVNVEGYQIAYKHSFDTCDGETETLNFKLKDFQASFRGRDLDKTLKITAENICEVGFLVKNTVAIGFTLSLFNLCFLEL